MASYVEESLGTGEEIKYVAQVSLWRYWMNFLIGGVVLIVCLPALGKAIFASASASKSAVEIALTLVGLMALLILFWPFLARRSTELVITNKRVVAKFGLLSTHSIEMRFDKVETVRVTQGLLGRMLNYGDIMVTGTGSTFDPIPNISHPLTFRSALNQAMEAGGTRPVS